MRKFTARLQCGMGNQLFEIAHATAQGFKHGVLTEFLYEERYRNTSEWNPKQWKDNLFRNVTFVDSIEIDHVVIEKGYNDPCIGDLPDGNIQSLVLNHLNVRYTWLIHALPILCLLVFK